MSGDGSSSLPMPAERPRQYMRQADQFRKLASEAHSPEARRQFVLLAGLYQRLAIQAVRLTARKFAAGR